MTELKSWGSPYIGDAHNGNYQCPHCFWFAGSTVPLPTTDDWMKHVIGFEVDRQPREGDEDCDDVGKVVISCPHCMRRYWLHSDVRLTNALIARCPNWPK